MSNPSKAELMRLRLDAAARDDAALAGLQACITGVPRALVSELMARGWSIGDALATVLDQQEQALHRTAEEVLG